MEALKEIGAQSPFLPSVRCKEEANALYPDGPTREARRRSGCWQEEAGAAHL
jgi:hypothetical protein